MNIRWPEDSVDWFLTVVKVVGVILTAAIVGLALGILSGCQPTPALTPRPQPARGVVMVPNWTHTRLTVYARDAHRQEYMLGVLEPGQIGCWLWPSQDERGQLFVPNVYTSDTFKPWDDEAFVWRPGGGYVQRVRRACVVRR